MIKKFFLSVLCIGVFLATPLTSFAKTKVSVAVEEDILDSYIDLLEEKQQTVYELTDLKSSVSSRRLASLVIMLQALKSGGFEIEPEFILTPNSRRSRRLVKNAVAAISGEDYWSNAFSEDTYKSSAVILAGEYFKGIYGLPGNKALNKLNEIEDFKQLTAVSSHGWVTDWQTLEKLELKSLFTTTSRDSMVKLVFYRGIDFALLDFTEKSDLNIRSSEMTLSPVSGIKLGLNDSRHFMVSMNHVAGKRIYEALEAGLSNMREAGLIRKYYTDVNFYREELADWKVLKIQ